MTSLGKIYSDKETRGGIVVNKGYQVQTATPLRKQSRLLMAHSLRKSLTAQSVPAVQSSLLTWFR